MYVGRRDIVITIPREGYFQTALLIGKGTFDEVRTEGVGRFRERVTEIQRVAHTAIRRPGLHTALPSAGVLRRAVSLPTRAPVLGRLVGAGVRPEHLDF